MTITTTLSTSDLTQEDYAMLGQGNTRNRLVTFNTSNASDPSDLELSIFPSGQLQYTSSIDGHPTSNRIDFRGTALTTSSKTNRGIL